MKRIAYIHCSFIFFVLMVARPGFAQDTAHKKTIDITSTFKPVLKEAAKVNFTAAPPAADTRKPSLQYTIPEQNLFFSYQSVPLQPVALPIDSSNSWVNSNYIKVGAGNVILPYIKAGFSFGDGKSTNYNVFADHYSAKGSLPFQKDNRTNVAATVSYKTASNLEWDGKLGFKSEQYFHYGYQPSALVFTKDQLRQQYQTFGGSLALRNIEPTEYGLNYHPKVQIAVFGGQNDIHKATEANSVLDVPLQKMLGDDLSINLGLTADLTNYRPRNNPTLQNNLFYVSPSVDYITPNLHLNAGIRPSWQNKQFSLLPDFMADITTNDQRFTLQLGWTGHYDKGSYQRFTSINPWIELPDELRNTKVQELYAGFKGSILNHFTYNAKLGYVSYHDMALFVNDTLDGKSFNTLYSSLNDLRLHAEIGYIQGENFNATAKLTLNQYSIKDQFAAWGLLPIEFGASLRWKVLKDLWLNSDLDAWSGAPYRNAAKFKSKGEGAFDLSAGLEYKIAKQLNLWFQMNNIFNNKYERWHQYESYGFNVLGGIIFSFNQK